MEGYQQVHILCFDHGMHVSHVFFDARAFVYILYIETRCVYSTETSWGS